MITILFRSQASFWEYTNSKLVISTSFALSKHISLFEMIVLKFLILLLLGGRLISVLTTFYSLKLFAKWRTKRTFFFFSRGNFLILHIITLWNVRNLVRNCIWHLCVLKNIRTLTPRRMFYVWVYRRVINAMSVSKKKRTQNAKRKQKNKTQRRTSNTMHKKSKLKISYKCIMHINMWICEFL